MEKLMDKLKAIAVGIRENSRDTLDIIQKNCPVDIAGKKVENIKDTAGIAKASQWISTKVAAEHHTSASSSACKVSCRRL